MMYSGYACIRMYARLHPLVYPCDARTVPPKGKPRYPQGGNLHPYGLLRFSYFFIKYLPMYIVYYSIPMEKVILGYTCIHVIFSGLNLSLPKALSMNLSSSSSSSLSFLTLISLSTSAAICSTQYATAIDRTSILSS